MTISNQETTITNPPVAEYFVSSHNNEMHRRIRVPHNHDVLCGRGGGINGHAGNRVFRDMVAKRRLDYSLASSKAEKARVATEVMNQVSGLSPPGRFLARDTSGGIGSWWIEVDESKAMAKISQALREGAPSIREQHQDDLKATMTTRNRGSKRTRSFDTENSHKSKKVFVATPNPLAANAPFQQGYAKTTKVKPKMVTPTFIPSTNASDIPPPLHLEAENSNLWMISDDDHIGEFVNPFEFENEEGLPIRIVGTKQVGFNLVPLLPPGKTHARKSNTVTGYTENISDWKITSDDHLVEFTNPFENEARLTIRSLDSKEFCLNCGITVQYGKTCTCLSNFDPLNEITSLSKVN